MSEPMTVREAAVLSVVSGAFFALFMLARSLPI